jgi:hypothetical protein
MRSSRRAHGSENVITTVTEVTPTPLDEVGLVAHGGTTVEKLN